MADCTSNPVSCWIADQVDVLTNIAQNLQSVDRLITGAAYLMGLAFGVKAMMTLKELGESKTMMSGHKSLKEPLLYFLVAAMLIYLPTGFEVFMNTTFGYSSVLSYAPIDSNSSALDILFGQGSMVGSSLAIIIQTIGLVAFVRGWILISRSANQGQPGGTGKGLVHIFGGILAMNIVGTLQIINNTLYGSS
ncbi:MAG: type IV secretion protein IcmC [Legionellales bacterium]|nr:type IV secretion protein IcmC [Legionellales bacterium]